MIGYKQVSGNSNVAFEYPLKALLIKNDSETPDFSPEISIFFEEDATFNNWMYIRKNRTR
jgi:hypothetical protein